MSGHASERRKASQLRRRVGISKRFRRTIETLGANWKLIDSEKYKRARPDIGRNDPCPCGRLKDDGAPIKWKKCHGRNT